ncbi:MAG: hypothetical protein KC619_34680 [Myxococcales bacterium]|nr:hypothetical protein [Myxococcales bacterium]
MATARKTGLALGAAMVLTMGCGSSTTTDSGVAPGFDAGVIDGGGSPGADAGPFDAALPDGSAPGTDAGEIDGGGPSLDAGGGVADPGEATGATVTTTSHSLSRPSTTIPLTIYLPADPSPAPVIVFHHGFQLSPDDYASYGEHLASWGYVVVMPQMPGGLIGGPNHRELGEHLGAILDWVAAGGDEIAGRVDATRIALAGHSLGGKISLLRASSDSRVRAVFGVDPVDSGAGPLGGSAADYPSVTPELMGSITVPIVLLGETTNGSCTGFGCMPCAPADQNFHQYFTNAASPALEIDVQGANHMSFLDDPACGFTCSVCSAGSDDTAVTRRLTRRSMTAFFQVILRGDDRYRTYLTGDAMAADVSAGLVTTATRNGF